MKDKNGKTVSQQPLGLALSFYRVMFRREWNLGRWSLNSRLGLH